MLILPEPFEPLFPCLLACLLPQRNLAARCLSLVKECLAAAEEEEDLLHELAQARDRSLHPCSGLQKLGLSTFLDQTYSVDNHGAKDGRGD